MNLEYLTKLYFGLLCYALVASSTPTDEGEVCTLPKDAGKCRGVKPSFYFNSENKRCQIFHYGGCGGNGNRFNTLQSCHQTCKHLMPDPDDVKAHIQTPQCLNVAARGKCRGFFPKVTFNPQTLKCEPFIFGGCGPNENLYNSESECFRTCYHNDHSTGAGMHRAMGLSVVNKPPEIYTVELVAVDTEEDVCSLPPVEPRPFSCSGFMPKWTFDRTLGSCRSYIYGGCGGTKNLFDSREACQAKCGNVQKIDSSAETCGLPLVRGRCKHFLPKYGFNTVTSRCEKFIYGGCGGNDNKFDTLEECVNLCGGMEPEESLACEASTCNTREAIVYRAKGCQPILKKGECCPSSWDCSIWDNRLRNLDKCFWANEDLPFGKLYNNGERMTEANDPSSCRMVCQCTVYNNESNIVCAMPGCYWPGLYARGENCITAYKDQKSCCPSVTVCDDDLANLHQCKLDDRVYYQGQRMYPKEDPCKVCFCNTTWNGDLADKENCQTIDCGLNYQTSQKLIDGCQPVFRDGACCPIDWICPEKQTPVSEIEEDLPRVSSMVICPAGVAIRSGSHLSPLYPPTDLHQSHGEEAYPVPESDPSDACLLPRTLGPCEGFQEAWFFDLKTRGCRKFKTGGPGSGGNLFETEDACKKTCAKYLHTGPRECKYTTESTKGTNAVAPLIMCLSETTRYRYNVENKKCEAFLDPTCGRFVRGYTSIDECELECLPEEAIEEEEVKFIPGKEGRCNNNAEVGRCRSRMTRFYYDTTTGKCSKFYYSGCGGTGNNFRDERDCIETCVKDENLGKSSHPQDLTVNAACRQDPAVAGPCKSSRPRFSFDASTNTCKMFFYGGCQGNDNNFKTFKECQASCPVDMNAQEKHQSDCDLPIQMGNCRATRGLMTRYFYNSTTEKCEKFGFTGCGGNENNFKDLPDCKLQCELPKIHRKVSGLEPKVTIEPVDKETDNSENTIPSDEDPCLMSKEIGICRAAIRRFYFDQTTKECKRFIFGGCGGNINNFLTLPECENACAEHLSEEKKLARAKSVGNPNLPANPICSLPLQVGPCMALIPSFYFDRNTLQCVSFDYGGCKGNENRFSSLESCQAACPPQNALKPTISLPPPTPKCTFGNQTYNLGDKIRFDRDRCKTCFCLTPPDIQCIAKMCISPLFIPTGTSDCKPTYDEDGCCIEGYSCKPKAEEASLSCQDRTCIEIDPVPRPNQVCRGVLDGCCTGGIICNRV